MASSKKVYNVGIIGYGLSTKVFHIPFINLNPQLRLHSIVQRSPSPGSSAPADHPTLSHHTSHEPMLADPDVDLVVIATPPNTHFAFASAALAAGKHVLCEKPFVPSSAEASTLSKLAASKPGLVLCVYQNRRWDSDFLTVRKLLAEGSLGRVFEFETHFDRYRLAAPSGGWKASLEMDNGGGPLFDLGSHLIDQAVVLFGAPERVWGRLASQRGEADGWDSVTAHLLYGRGLEVIVRIGIASCEARQLRFWVRGTKGSFKKWGLDSMEDQLRHAGYKGTEPDFGHEDKIYEGRLCTATETGEIGEEVPYPNVEPVTYRGIYEGIVKAIESGKPEDVPVPADQAATVLRIIEAIRESAEAGREVEVKKA